MTITYNLILREINIISFAKIKSLLQRKRFRFSKRDIAKYLLAIITHQKDLINYKTLYKQEKRQDSYENYIKKYKINLQVITNQI